MDRLSATVEDSEWGGTQLQSRAIAGTTRSGQYDHEEHCVGTVAVGRQEGLLTIAR